MISKETISQSIHPNNLTQATSTPCIHRFKKHSFSPFYHQFKHQLFLKTRRLSDGSDQQKSCKTKTEIKKYRNCHNEMHSYFHWRSRAHLIIFYSVCNVYLLEDVLTKVDQFFGHLGKVMSFTCKIVNQGSTGWNAIKVSLYKLVLLTNYSKETSTCKISSHIDRLLFFFSQTSQKLKTPPSKHSYFYKYCREKGRKFIWFCLE